MGWYTTKKTLMRPVVAVRRWRWASRCSPYTRAMYEQQGYRRSIRRFFRASRENREILFDVDLPPGAVVIDVGAFEGEWSSKVLARADRQGVPDVRIHAFEPVPSARKRLPASMAADERFVLHPVGLGGRDRSEVMAVAGPGSSLYVDPEGPQGLGRTDVEIHDADAVLTELAIDRIDLIKVNIEGAEFELLDRLHETGWLARTGTLIVQFHEFAPGAYRGRRRNRRQLSATHRCTWDYPWIYERWDPKA